MYVWQKKFTIEFNLDNSKVLDITPTVPYLLGFRRRILACLASRHAMIL
jgi:hypothetical protein